MNIEVQWHGREKNEAAHYCSTCEVSNFYRKSIFHIEGLRSQLENYQSYIRFSSNEN